MFYRYTRSADAVHNRAGHMATANGNVADGLQICYGIRRILRCVYFTALLFVHPQLWISVIDSTKVLCPVFGEIETESLVLPERFLISGQNVKFQFIIEQEVKVIWQKAPHGGSIPRLGVTPGGRKLYHWIPGVGFPISVP